MGFVQQPFAFEFDTVFWEVNDKYFVGTYVVLYSFTVHFFEHPPAAKLSVRSWAYTDSNKCMDSSSVRRQNVFSTFNKPHAIMGRPNV